MAASKHLIAVITGASSGIGRATASLFAKKGYYLSLSDRDEKALQETVEQCVRDGTPKQSILTTTGDITEEKVAQSLIDRTFAKFGQLNTLVNSAGILVGGKLVDSKMSDYDHQMNINVRSIVQLTQMAVPHLIKTKGTIVNLSSINGQSPVSGIIFYCMSKTAIDQFTRCLALELGPHGVRVNAVSPGVTVTNLHTTAGLNQEQYKQFLDRSASLTAMCRVGTAQEIANGIYFLASEQSSFTTGEILRVDGGKGIMHLR